ncbi:hypothetical protein [Spirosoma areae]
MPFVSKKTHTKLFSAKEKLDERFEDVIKVVRALQALNINRSLKSRMLKEALWHITYYSGDFLGRYRSSEVINQLGVPIQREHVFELSKLVERLLNNEIIETEEIISHTTHCIVSKIEHDKLTAYSKQNPHVHGWDRYTNAGIIVHDMLTGDLLFK